MKSQDSPKNSCDLSYENQLREEGCAVIAGVDEAGRGPLAGPVMAAAVVLPEDFQHGILTDSKKLTARVRAHLYEELTANEQIKWASAEASVKEIDRINILRATGLAMRRAVEKLPNTPDCVLIDGLEVRDFPLRQMPLVGGDGLSLSIAAASIVAKVERDRLMEKMAERYPDYGFESHKGYGTRRHLEQLRKLGPCPIHRFSFRPVAQLTLPFDER